MDDRIPALVFGAFLVLAGGLMLASQFWAAGRVAAEDPDRQERQFLTRRIRRRKQVAGLILMIGLMIPVGDALIPWRRAPGTFAIYWGLVIALAIWTILLAVGDIVSTRAHAAIELNRLRQRQTELENAARRLQQERRNGAANSED